MKVAPRINRERCGSRPHRGLNRYGPMTPPVVAAARHRLRTGCGFWRGAPVRHERRV